jgi:hypothetical protein
MAMPSHGTRACASRASSSAQALIVPCAWPGHVPGTAEQPRLPSATLAASASSIVTFMRRSIADRRRAPPPRAGGGSASVLPGKLSGRPVASRRQLTVALSRGGELALGLDPGALRSGHHDHAARWREQDTPDGMSCSRAPCGPAALASTSRSRTKRSTSMIVCSPVSAACPRARPWDRGPAEDRALPPPATPFSAPAGPSGRRSLGRRLSVRRSAPPVRRSRQAARRDRRRRRRPPAARSSGFPAPRRPARGAAWPPRRPGS